MHDAPPATPLCRLLGCRLPLMLAGMGGVSRSELVAAVTEAGGFGFLGMVREPLALIEREVAQVRQRTALPFGVNLIPAATPAPLLRAQVDLLIALQVPVVSLFWDVDAGVIGTGDGAVHGDMASKPLCSSSITPSPRSRRRQRRQGAGG